MKKWSYTAAMMLALAGGSMLTGCIDNDEPAGILAVRLATADLLKAQAEAADAEKARHEADVAIEKIKAETDAAKIKADAAKAEAEAAIEKIKAEAEAAQTQAEAARLQAQADDIKAKTEAYIAEEKAKLDRYIAETEALVNKANLCYEKALYQFEKDKADNASEVTNKLYDAYVASFGVYLQKLEAYNKANEALLYAQKQYAMAAVDLKYVDGKWESPKYDAKEKLYAQREYLADLTEQTNKEIDEIKEYITDLSGVTESDLYKLYEKYSGLEEQAKADYLTAKSELETLKGENKDLYDKLDAAETELAEIESEEHPVAAYTYPGSTLIPLPAYKEEVEIIGKGAEWTYRNAPWTYTNYVNDYQNLINSLTNSLLDENDKAWTNATLAELNRKLTADTETFNEIKAAWELAKKAYNNGGVADGSVYPNADEVKTTVDAYNAEEANMVALAEALETANKDVQDAYEAWEAADKEYDGDLDTPGTNASSVRRQAFKEIEEEEKAAQEEYNEAERAAAETQARADLAAEGVFHKAWDDYYALLDEIDALQRQVDAGDTSAQAALTAAKAKEEAAETAANGAQAAWQTAQENNAKAYEKAVAAANTKLVQAMNAVNAKRSAADLAYNQALVNDPAAAPVKAAWDAYEAAMEKAGDAQKAVSDKEAGLQELREAAYVAVATQIEELNNPAELQFYWDASELVPDEETVQSYITKIIYGWDDVEFPAAVAPAEYEVDGVYVFAKTYLVQTSVMAYGNMAGYDFDNGYPELSNEAFLVADVTPEMVNEYIKKYFGVNAEGEPNIKPWDYYNYYSWFGAYGQVLLLQDRIAVATAMLDNNDLINEMLKEPEANLAALKAEFETVEENVEAAAENVEAINKEIEAIEKAATTKVENAGKWYGLYNAMVADLEGNIAFLEDLKLGEKESLADYIESSINTWNKAIENKENYISGYIEVLQKENEYMIDLYEKNEDTVLPNPYTIAVKLAEANVEVAKENLDFWSARTEDAKKAYEATKE